MSKYIICPVCQGEGTERLYNDDYTGHPDDYDYQDITCRECNGWRLVEPEIGE